MACFVLFGDFFSIIPEKWSMDRTDFRKRMEKVDPLNKANPFAKL